MERITLMVRTQKTDGEIRLRFRLTDGRAVAMFHKSDIKAKLEDLDKFTAEGTVKPKTKLYNKQLAKDILTETTAMREAYQQMKTKSIIMNSDNFEARIKSILYPEVIDRKEDNSLITRFKKYIDSNWKDGIYGISRHKHYNELYGKLERYLKIKKSSEITPAEFTVEWLMDFRNFIFEEYKYVERHKRIYSDLKKGSIPTERRNPNTVAGHMKMLQAFFTELENEDEIVKSPFRKIGLEKKKSIMRSRYDEPYYLYAEEFQKILTTGVPDNLQQVKNAFLLQCAFGFRISDFQNLTMDKIAVSKEGIPYIHYLPIKTKNERSDNKEIETPILKYALKIIIDTKLDFPLIRYSTGKSGYNVKIKELFKYLEMDRKVTIFDQKLQDNIYVPLCEVASSKLCRKTHVDMLNKVQVNMYAAGLHSEGSDAVNHYTKLELKDRFILMCTAFKQPQYKVDKELNVIE